MRHRVRNILLVSSLYDYFILAEDGQLNKALLTEYSQLHLSENPVITWVSSGEEALALVRKEWRFDLVIVSMHVGDMDANELATRVNANEPHIPVVLLAYNSRELTEYRARRDLSALDKVFLWQGHVRILLAIVKYVEDRLNAAYDTGIAGVPAIIVVEDSVRYYSSFLPAIYAELVENTRRGMSEALNITQKLLRLRARPKVLLCETYEEAWDYFSTYARHILGVISDVEFAWGGESRPDAGAELARRIHAEVFDIPIVIQSSRESNERVADEVGATFLQKSAPDLIHSLRRVLVEQMRFGDFIFRMPDGHEVARASDLAELIECMHTVPAQSLVYHATNNHFSVWLKARGEIVLAHELRPKRVADCAHLEELRDTLIGPISDYRYRRDQVVVADFDRWHRRLDVNLSRIGGGSLGGKARGLAFANRLLADYNIAADFPDIDVRVPTAVVLGTDVFDQFVEQDGLHDFLLSAESDAVVLERVLAAPFPEEARKDLDAFLHEAPFPLAVRSSSLLEDSPYQPLAGVYDTFMLPNNHEDMGTRLETLIEGVKRVWASTFLRHAKSFLRTTPYLLEEEKMGVIVERVVGTHYVGRHYPSFAGVARSHDFYPIPPQKSDDGIMAVALGLGKTVTDGGKCLRVSPRYPLKIPAMSTVDDILRNAQRSFYALDMTTGRGGFSEADLHAYDLEVAEKDGTLAPVGATYDVESRIIRDGISRQGPRVVTFAGVLKHGQFPLAELIDRLLEISSDACNGPVEIEFAVTLPVSKKHRPEFGFLQLRPLALFGEQDVVEIGDVDPARVLCWSPAVLGNGKVTTVHDILWIDPQGFDRNLTREIAAEVNRVNAGLVAEERPYLLVGSGRWGSADPYLGVPVTWSQINGARVIVESSFDDLSVDPSQGSHFFQNLTTSEIGYFTVHPRYGESHVDWDWLRAQTPPSDERWVRHLRLDAPLEIRMNGHTGEGVVLKP